MSGGNTSTSGGTNQKGMLTTRATTAKSVLSADQASPLQMEPPRRRSRSGKRRLATRRTMAGVIASAATRSDATTNAGSASATTIRGAMTLAQPAPPIERSHANTASSSDQSSSVARTDATAGSQKK